MGLRIMVNLEVDGAEVEDLYLARGVLKMVDQGFQDDGIETPEHIVDKLNAINAEITNRNRAELQRRLKAAKARREGFRTREEKASKLDEEITDLEKKLG